MNERNTGHREPQRIPVAIGREPQRTTEDPDGYRERAAEIDIGMIKLPCSRQKSLPLYFHPFLIKKLTHFLEKIN